MCCGRPLWVLSRQISIGGGARSEALRPDGRLLQWSGWEIRKIWTTVLSEMDEKLSPSGYIEGVTDRS